MNIMEKHIIEKQDHIIQNIETNREIMVNIQNNQEKQKIKIIAYPKKYLIKCIFIFWVKI